jgi:hypothetical protein
VKIAYIILAYKDASQVNRLINKLRTDETTFVVHICKDSTNAYYRELKNLQKHKQDVLFCKRESGIHYYYGLVNGTMNALKLLIDKKIEFDYVNLISGQDYPIKSNKEINEFFEKNKGKEYILYWPLFPTKDSEFYKNHPWGLHRQLYRIDRYHLKFFGKMISIPELLTGRLISHSFIKTLKIFIYESPKYIREKRWREELVLLILSRILPKNRNIPNKFEIYGGKTWWSITKECAEYIVNFNRKNHSFNRFFKYTLIPDEMYFQTIIMNSYFKEKVENNYLREIEWAGGDGTHPIIFTNFAFERLKNTDALFARKFDVNIDFEVLDSIDGIT